MRLAILLGNELVIKVVMVETTTDNPSNRRVGRETLLSRMYVGSKVRGTNSVGRG